MKPYKLKHIPTGLYFQPHKHRGSHLSKNGKIYQTKTNGLSSCISGNHSTFRIYCEFDSLIYKQTKDIINWSEAKRTLHGGQYGQVWSETNFNEWIIEEI